MSYSSLATKALAGMKGNQTRGERKGMSKSKGKRLKIRKKGKAAPGGFGSSGFGSARKAAC